MGTKRILVIPDACFTDGSGASVSMVVLNILREMGHQGALFTHEVSNMISMPDGTLVFPKRPFTSLANLISSPYKRNLIRVIEAFKPDIVFTIGSVTNKPVCYWRIARNRGIGVISMVFMQDFFCSNFYANDQNGLCVRCLEDGFSRVLTGPCHPFKGNTIQRLLRALLAIITRNLFKRELPHIGAIITSSRQQMGFFVRYGIPVERCYIIPLFFNGDKLKRYNPSLGNYYVFVAQDRIEKGIHLLKEVLCNCNNHIRLIAAFSSDIKEEVWEKYGLRPFVDNGILEVKTNCSWKTDLGELMAGCRGVVNPSIWPTTTEFVLLEALGLKKPVFTFNVGIHAEIIESGINGFVADTPSQMAIQMNRFFDDDALYYEVSINAYHLYERLTNRIAWEKHLATVIDDVCK